MRPSSLILLGAMLLAHGCDGGPNVPNAHTMKYGPASNLKFTPDSLGGEAVNAEELATKLCGRLMECNLLTSTYLKMCVDQLKSYADYIIDASTFLGCFMDLDCSMLKNLDDYADILTQCMKVDLESLTCQGTQFHFCTQDGQCKNLDCNAWCNKVQNSAGICQMDSDGEAACKCTGETDAPMPNVG